MPRRRSLVSRQKLIEAAIVKQDVIGHTWAWADATFYELTDPKHPENLNNRHLQDRMLRLITLIATTMPIREEEAVGIPEHNKNQITDAPAVEDREQQVLNVLKLRTDPRRRRWGYEPTAPKDPITGQWIKKSEDGEA